MIEPIDLDQLAAVTGGRITNEGADPALIDSVTGLGAQVNQVGTQMVQLQQQFDQQMFQMLTQGTAQPAAAAAPQASMLEGIL